MRQAEAVCPAVAMHLALGAGWLGAATLSSNVRAGPTLATTAQRPVKIQRARWVSRVRQGTVIDPQARVVGVSSLRIADCQQHGGMS